MELGTDWGSPESAVGAARADEEEEIARPATRNEELDEMRMVVVLYDAQQSMYRGMQG